MSTTLTNDRLNVTWQVLRADVDDADSYELQQQQRQRQHSHCLLVLSSTLASSGSVTYTFPRTRRALGGAHVPPTKKIGQNPKIGQL